MLGALLDTGGSSRPYLDMSTRDGLAAPWLALREQLRDAGCELVSEDKLLGLKPDFFIHINAQPLDYDAPAFAILTECELLHPANLDFRLLRQYRAVFTWNPRPIEAGVATKIQLAHPLGVGVVDGYAQRPKLLVMIAANKALPVWHPSSDLYRERVRAIRWFERHAPDDFALYGYGWDFLPRQPTRLGGVLHRAERLLPWRPRWFSTWHGTLSAKRPVLASARFSLAYENVRGLRGYITEKIFDAFCAGNVPIYWGAEDVTDFIPAECFIDRRRFATHAELYNHLCCMPEERYLGYQHAIRDFLESDAAQAFSVKCFAQVIASGILASLDEP